MKRQPQISVLIAWANREEVGYSLLKNTSWFVAENVEVIIINAGGDGELLDRCVAESRIPNLCLVDVPISRFNKSLALNLGLSFATGHLVFILDADIIIGRDFLAEARPLVELGGGVVTVKNMLQSRRMSSTPMTVALGGKTAYIQSVREVNSVELVFSDDTCTRIVTSATELLSGSTAAPGLLLVQRSDLLAIGGYNSDLQTWGWEDNDVLLRLCKMCCVTHREVGEALHLTHSDSTRALFGVDKWESDKQNMVLCLERYARAEFLGTYARDTEMLLDKCVQRIVRPKRQAVQRDNNSI